MSILESLSSALSNSQKSDNIIGRDSERAAIEDFIIRNVTTKSRNSDSKQEGKQEVCYVYGQPGTGKSLILSSVLSAGKVGRTSYTYKHVNCMNLNLTTFAAAIMSIITTVCVDYKENLNLPKAGMLKSFDLDAWITILDECLANFKQRLVLVLDEADCLEKLFYKTTQKDRISLFHFLVKYTVMSRKSYSVIFVGNTHDILECLSKGVNELVCRVPFRGYETEDLINVVLQKIESVKKAHPDESLELSAKVVELGVRRAAAVHSGDCRQVLGVLKKMIMEEIQSEGSARSALTDALSSNTVSFRKTLDSLPLHTQIVMIAVIKEQMKLEGDILNFYSIFFAYKNLCSAIHIKSLLEDNVKRSLDILGANGFISSISCNSKSTNKRAKISKLKSPGRSAVKKASQPDEYVASLSKEVLDYVESNEATIVTRLVEMCKLSKEDEM